MQEKTVVVRDANNGTGPAAIGILAILVIVVAAALYMWQPWNTSGQHNTTIIQTQPGGANGSSGGSSGSSGSSGSGNGSSGSSSGSSGSSSGSSSGQ